MTKAERSRIRSAVEQQSIRIDNQMVATITAVGAAAKVVGAVAGGAIRERKLPSGNALDYQHFETQHAA